jgi:hypothetical protein
LRAAHADAVGFDFQRGKKERGLAIERMAVSLIHYSKQHPRGLYYRGSVVAGVRPLESSWVRPYDTTLHQ